MQNTLNPSLHGRVLFLGLGIMGAPMARNIAAKGNDVLVWNRSTEKAQALQSDGIVAVEDLKTLQTSKTVAILMVSTGDVVDDLLFGDIGLADKLAPGSTVVVMSSIPVDAAKHQAMRLTEAGVHYIDAPVSGGERGAIDGRLTIMAGGDTKIIDGLRPLLEAMGSVTHVGPHGAGQLAKLANQTIVGVTIGAVAEALLLAEAGGADPRAVREALLGGFADSTVLRQHGERMIEKSFEPGGRCHIQLKDVSTAHDLATDFGLQTPLLKETRSLYEAVCKTSLRDLDHSALYLHLRNLAAHETS